MFELSVALKYLIPRWKQLSVSIISLISVLVIALIVWLIVVFFSVTNGLEKSWTEKLVNLTAPVRVNPTEKYYDSYYYQIDSISDSSDYTLKSINEKKQSPQANPYDPTYDQEIPLNWQTPDLDDKGNLKDLTKLALQAIKEIKPQFQDISANDYEMTYSNLKIRVLRPIFTEPLSPYPQYTQSFLSQASYLNSFDPHHKELTKTLLPISPEDLTNILYNLSISSEDIRSTAQSTPHSILPSKFQDKLKLFLDNVTISHLKTSQQGWLFPFSLLPKEGKLQACAIFSGNSNDSIKQLILPLKSSSLKSMTEKWRRRGFKASIVSINLSSNKKEILLENATSQPLNHTTPILLEGNVLLSATLIPKSSSFSSDASDLQFYLKEKLQEYPFEGVIRYENLQVGKAKVTTELEATNTPLPFWFHTLKQNKTNTKKDQGYLAVLPTSLEKEEGVLLAKQFYENGIRLGDRGFLSYYAPTTSSIREQRIPIFVAGFYDPGIIPLGGKFITVNKEITSLVRGIYSFEDQISGNGINVRSPFYKDAEAIKIALQEKFKEKGIDSYWKIETYKEYEFTKELIQQLQSEKNLFLLISIIILIVACSNIISMLIILVNNKKSEIGILRSMGASALSIAFIFGICGMIMGILGSFIGTVGGWITLKYINELVSFISYLQGHELLNSTFYGDILPNSISFESLIFVLITTSSLSILAGTIPAIKAALLKPAIILRGE